MLGMQKILNSSSACFGISDSLLALLKIKRGQICYCSTAARALKGGGILEEPADDDGIRSLQHAICDLQHEDSPGPGIDAPRKRKEKAEKEIENEKGSETPVRRRHHE